MKLFRLLFLFMLCANVAHAQSIFDYRIWGVNTSSAVKAPVVAATTAGITLSGAQTIDGIAVTDHLNDTTGLPPDRVLVKNQTDQTTNGIYNVNSSGAWTEAPDFANPNNVVNGTIIIVARGNVNAGLWQLTTANPVVVAPDTSGASNITFAAYTATSASAILGSVCTTTGGIFDYNGSAYGCIAPPVSSPAFLMGNIGAVPSYVTNLSSLPGTGGTLTLPAGPDTITGNAATDTFTNKTFDTGSAGNVLKINGTQISSVSGNTSKVATASGALTNTHCVSIDGSGNFVDAGGACTTGGGGGTVSSATQYQIAYYTGTGTTVGGQSSLVTDAHGVLNIGAGTITSNDPALSVTQTWNSSGATFSGIFENITNTASAAGSLLENLQIGGSTKWSIDKNGNVTNGTWEGTTIGSTYLPTATGAALGLAEAGTNISVSSGVFSVATGSSSTKGVVQTDGSTISNSAGTISCTSGTTSQLGCLEPDGLTITVSGGVISAAASGGLKLLATVNASAASSVSFSSSYITSAYNKYEIDYDGVYTSDQGLLYAVVSNNNGSTWQTGAHYQWQLYGSSLTTGQTFWKLTGGADGGSNSPISGTIKFSNPSSAAWQTFSADETDATGAGWIYHGVFSLSGSSTFNALKIYDSLGGNITGNFHLYGIQGT